MKKDLLVLLFLSFVTCLVYFKSLNVFFAQDDFILISEFSQNSLFVDLGNVIGAPKVTHWRPVQNLYYFIAGNIFCKNYLGYHLITFLLHIISAFFIYKFSINLLHKKSASFFCALIYAISPVHFVSLSWISGNAVLIGFFFYIISLNLYVKKNSSALLFYFLSLLASEAFFFASLTFWFWDYLMVKKLSKKGFLFILSSLFFIFYKFLFLTPASTFEVYQLDLSFSIIRTVKYYFLRVFGFAESSGDLFASLILVFVLLMLFVVFIKNFRHHKSIIFFPLGITISGLFPFIILKDHVSAHYMSLSLFGFSLMCATAYLNFNRRVQMALVVTFAILFSYSVNLSYNNNWVIKRALIAKSYIDKVRAANLAENSSILFAGDDLNVSEAYYSLGGGEAFGLFFKDKNYKVCFDVFENCNTLP